MLGDKVGAIEAERLGMVYDVYHEDEFEQKVTEMANRLSGMPTRALALVKHAFNQSMSSGYEAQLELEDRFQQEAALTYDYREGVEAFMQKRSPVFRGE
jgi:2-(1,2-epoxy-1,2-dihydrophenyl)acetyl-CoA isomerase